MANSTSSTMTVAVEARTEQGKNACRRLRADGRVPANVYGLGIPSYSVSVAVKRIREVLQKGTGQNTILTLTVPGQDEKREVMIRELQRDPVTARPLHVDFIRVDTSKPVQVSVPVQLQGTPEGVKNEGGILDFVNREVAISCLPLEIPAHLDVDVSALHINQHVAVKDIQASEGVELIDDPESIIAVVVPPKVEATEVAEEEEAAAAEGAAAEPKEEEGKTE